ncbi:MAG: protein-L-isoaspartate O-methyltransferase [Sphingobium sp.]
MSQVDFAAMRAAMVASQLRTSDVNDTAVIAAMSRVPREDYVPAERRETAYVDRPIPLGNGRSLNPPLATGRLLTVAEIAAGDKVLLLNDATGYAAALLDAMGAVVTVVDEGDRPAGAPGAISWVKGRAGDGHAAGAPYDVILIDGAVEDISDPLKAQLVDGGRIAAGLTERGVTRLVSGRKVGDAVGFLNLADMEMASAAGFEARPREFVF